MLSRNDYAIDNFSPNALNEGFNGSLRSYELIEHTNTMKLSSKIFEAKELKDDQAVLEEDCYLLRKPDKSQA